MHPFLSDDEVRRIEANLVERLYDAEREARLQLLGKMPAPTAVSEHGYELLERAEKRRISGRI